MPERVPPCLTLSLLMQALVHKSCLTTLLHPLFYARSYHTRLPVQACLAGVLLGICIALGTHGPAQACLWETFPALYRACLWETFPALYPQQL